MDEMRGTWNENYNETRDERETENIQQDEGGLVRVGNTCATLSRAWHVRSRCKMQQILGV